MAGRACAYLVALAAPAVWLAGPLAGIAGAAAAPSGCPAWVTAAPAPAPATSPPTTTTSPTTTSMTAAPMARADAASVAGVLVASREALVSVSATAADVRAVVEYRSADHGFECTRPRIVGGAATNFAISELRPSSHYGFRVAAEVDGAAVLGPLRSFATLPSGQIAEGVRVGSVPVGRLDLTTATEKVTRQLDPSVAFTYAGAYWRMPASQLGLTSDAALLVRRALTSGPGASIRAPRVTIKAAPLRTYVTSVAKRFDRLAATPSVRLVGKHAVVTPAQPTIRVDTKTLRAQILRRLSGASATRIDVPVEKAKTAPLAQQRAVVVRLGSQTLTAYVNGRAVLKTPVTTGRPALPTPIGSFSVQFKVSPYVFHSPWPQGSPYYYPPTPVTWAMEFYDGDFLHDDPAEPASEFGSDSQNGYFASHGCVHVPSSVMSYLYKWLPVGAPVIVAQD